jgi:hypothetical protein
MKTLEERISEILRKYQFNEFNKPIAKEIAELKLEEYASQNLKEELIKFCEFITNEYLKQR